MPTWNDINTEIETLAASVPDPAKACDQVRSKYLGQLETKLTRPVIAYYSGFLQKRKSDGRFHPECAISDNDMNGFMATIHGLPRDRGLELILHTPGGEIEAARGIVEYLHKMFGRNVRVTVPQLAMSAGTMIACAADTITMAKHACLGPTDPHINGMPAMGVTNEIERAIEEIKKEPEKRLLWQQVFAKYPPGFIGNCERSIDGARTMVGDWLKQGMLKNESDPEAATQEAVRQLMDYTNTSGHNHHFMIDKCRAIGLKVVALEADQELQELVLSVHHAFMATFARTTAIKIINSPMQSWVVSAANTP